MRNLREVDIDNIPSDKQFAIRIAVASGWTELTYFLGDLFGIPPKGHRWREDVVTMGVKSKVPTANELAENMLVGPETDALVAEVLGYDVLGIVPCVLDYTGRYAIPYCGEGKFPRPVYLRNCICKLKQPSDIDYFGHFAGCLGIIKEYSLEDNFAFEIVDWLVEQDYSVLVETRHQTTSYCQICQTENREPLAGFERSVGWGQGKTRPLAICRALLEIPTQNLSVLEEN